MAISSEADLPGSLEESYKLLMRGADTVWQLEAAYRLVFMTPTLREWLIHNSFMRMHRDQEVAYMAVHFDEAVDRIKELSRNGREFSAHGPDKAGRAVLYAAASLSGQVNIGTLRHFMPDLEADDAQRVAEAMMYAAGFMDGAADPWANEAEGPGTGPNAVAHERRILGND